MVWWPFSSSSSSTPTTSISETRKNDAPARDVDATRQKGQTAEAANISKPEPPPSTTLNTKAASYQQDVSPKGAPSSDKPPKNIQAIEERLKELREPGLVNDGIHLQWMKFQEKWVPVVWREGVSATPAFGLSALFFATSALPNSVLPELPPRLARVAFGAAFGTAGAAIHSGDTWNGASIATWWSISHLLLSSITKSVRKEVAKKAGKTLSRTSPFAYVLTSATVATGLVYGITL